MKTYSGHGILDNRRIFMVEDNIENRAIMTMILERNGAETAFERWGRNSIMQLRAFAPVDVILLDLMLPNGASGYDIFDQIRALPEFANTPIVAVSASDYSTALPRARAKGFDGYIAKPVDYDLFPQQIAQIINREMVWYTGY